MPLSLEADGGEEIPTKSASRNPVATSSRRTIFPPPKEYHSLLSGPSASKAGEGSSSTSRSQPLTTPNTSPTPRNLLSPFTSHLLTPQSPGDNGRPSTSFDVARESPTRYGSPAVRLRTFQRRRTVSPEPISSLEGSFLTPESSPLFPRKARSIQARTPSPPTTPRPHPNRELQEDTPTPFPHAISQPSTPPSHNREISPPSGLSSPFVDRRTPAKSSTSRRTPSDGPDSPMVFDDLFSPGPSSSNHHLPSLQAPIPQRPVGGEIHRIRLQAAADQAARLEETESRRPDYLRRTKRPLPDFDFDAFEPMEQDSNLPNLGVTESPVKGRRLTLFQETSEESFEQSLLAGGFPRYGQLPGYHAPPTSQSKGKGNISQHTLEWLQQPTPGRPMDGRRSAEPDPDWVLSDKEIRKRRRLAAFEKPSAGDTQSRLYPVEIEGRGRVLLDHTLDEPNTRSEPQTKKRGSRRKKTRGGTGQTRRKTGHMSEINQADQEAAKPNWLDTVFPWSMRVEEREELGRMEHEEKMKWIERFLDRDSDEEAEDEEDQPFGSTAPDADEVNPPQSRPGRGKMVPLKAYPETKPRRISNANNLMIPSDPADARAALLSKRSVREFSFRWRQEALMNVELEEAEPEQEEVVCLCRGRDDGRELVQCDDCHIWYHLQCIGIQEVEELGKADDPWYCADCLEVMATPASDPASEPTFAPTDERPSSAQTHDPLFYQGSFQESPNVPWTTPRTPIRSSDHPSEFSSRSYGDSSRGGPSTPGSSQKKTHAYRTPTIFEGHSDEFDPTSTPSRGIKISRGSFSTPKTTHFWPPRDGLMTQTPRKGRDSVRLSSGRLPLLLGFSGGGTGGGMPPRTVYSYEDTPIRRSGPREERSQPLKRLLDSPLGTKSTALPMIGREGSPTLMLEGSRRIQRIRNRKSAPLPPPEN